MKMNYNLGDNYVISELDDGNCEWNQMFKAGGKHSPIYQERVGRVTFKDGREQLHPYHLMHIRSLEEYEKFHKQLAVLPRWETPKGYEVLDR